MLFVVIYALWHAPLSLSLSAFPLQGRLHPRPQRARAAQHGVEIAPRGRQHPRRRGQVAGHRSPGGVGVGGAGVQGGAGGLEAAQAGVVVGKVEGSGVRKECKGGAGVRRL